MDTLTFTRCLEVVNTEKQKLSQAVQQLEANFPNDKAGIDLMKAQFAEAEVIDFLLRELAE